VVVFDSVDAVSDSDVETKVQQLGGFGCKDFEGETELEAERVPRMNRFEDLSREDAIYYMGDGSVVHSADFVSYLSSVQDPLSVSDKCFDRCRREMDSLRSSKEMCDGSLASAMSCMQGSGESECVRSDFVNHHAKDCQRNITEDSRGLELQEAAEEHELLTNESLSARNLFGVLRGTCTSEFFVPARISGSMVWCSQAAFELPKFLQKVMGGFSFKLRFTYGLLGGKMGLAILVQGCAPFTLIFGIPSKPIFCKKCVGGEIKCVWKRACPQIPLTITGRVFFELRVGLDLVMWEVNFAKLTLEISAGLVETEQRKRGGRCWWESGEGPTRRRWWTWRRRNVKKCETETICDVYVKGLVAISALMDRIRLAIGFVYYVKSARLLCKMQFDIWSIFIKGWSELLAFTLFNFWF